MKKIGIVLAIAAIVISAKGFTEKTPVEGVIYYQDGNDVWMAWDGIVQAPGYCSYADRDPCTITFLDESILLEYPCYFTKEDLYSGNLLATYEGVGSVRHYRAKL
ncbi:hypothetical protein [Pedobacter gandavensis]|uniref:hypothetical protein n=1 Tax=Pedobacter gandavensis TaxID=2679963 RepID=UPI00292D150B|nr:hypothetical protein [Pedobacter gandavensis]